MIGVDMSLNNIGAISKGLAASLVAIVSIVSSLWFFGEPFLEDYVKEQNIKFLKSAEIQLHISMIVEQEKRKAFDRDANRKKLSHKLADKMGVPIDEVHILIGNLYRNEGIIKEEVESLVEDIYKLKQRVDGQE